MMTKLRESLKRVVSIRAYKTLTRKYILYLLSAIFYSVDHTRARIYI